VAAIVMVGGVVRLGLVACSSPQAPRPLEYSVIAEHLNSDKGYTFEQYGAVYRAWKEPLYIVGLAWLLRATSHSRIAILLMQGACGVAVALAAAWLGWWVLGDRWAATITGLLVAVNPFLVYYDTQWIHPLSLDSLLFVATVGTILIAARQPQGVIQRSVWAGLIAGLALWQRSTLLIVGLFAWAAVLWKSPSARRPMCRGMAIWCVVTLLVIAPWLLRNARLFGRLIMTTDAAHIVWLGNNPWSNGTYSDQAGHRVIAFADATFQEQLSQASELGQYDLFLGATRRFIVDHPGRFFQLILRRVGSFAWFSPNAGVGYPLWQEALYRIAYVSLLLMGAGGALIFWRRADLVDRRTGWVLIASVVGVAAVHAVTAINVKHRVPLELLLSIFASGGLQWCLGKR